MQSNAADAARETAKKGVLTVRDASDLITSKVQQWIEAAVANLPNLAVALLVALFFWLVARLARSVFNRGLQRTGLTAPIRNLITGALYFVILMTGIFIGLGVLGLDKTVTSLLAGVGIVGLAVGLAFQDILSNFMAGILLSLRKPFSIGQLIKTNDYIGHVQNINLRSTVIRLFTGQLVRIPNKDVLNNPIVNYTETGERRVDIAVGISYGDDLDKVRGVVLESLQGLTCRSKSHPVEVFFEEFGDSSINFTTRFWMDFKRQPDFMAARSEAIMAIKRAFDANGITIPFPIRTLDFGIVGGETLTESLRPLAPETGP